MTTTTAICAEYSTHTTEQQPVGPCVLRPGHRGHIHQDMRGMQWATRPDSDACCVCAASPVGYRNYCGQPFCEPCADGQDPAAGSDSVDELRARLHAAIRAIGRAEQENAELRRDNAQLLGEQAACIAAEQQRDRLAASLREVRAELHARDEALAKQRSNCQRALRDVCAVQRVRDLANRWYGQGAPATSYARELLATLDEVA
ncbi:cell division protein ZapB [Streptomyces sp. NPDC087769]|uniref:cell division protein ZapB n=1 Tax=Streptomyces sp. NPDC087769 TaxID=3365802 RepID=UPI00382C291E